MKSWRKLVWVLALAAPVAAAGELVDRIVAQVNHRVILESEVEDSLRYQSLVAGREGEHFTPEQRKQAIDQLVDQALIEEQIDRTTFARASQKDVDQRIAGLRQQFAGASNDAGWRALLERYGLTEGDVREMESEQVDIFRFVDARFRPNIRIDRRSIETYYNEEFLPQLRKSGARDVPLPEVSGKIEEILVQQRINELMTLWLRNLRLQEEVQVR